jgi:hypothetical protein
LKGLTLSHQTGKNPCNAPCAGLVLYALYSEGVLAA